MLDKKKFPLVLGGEHSLTAGSIRPFIKKFGKICLLHFDAHADLRNSYNNNKFSHASAIRRCLDNPNVSLVSFGIRNISSSEIPFLNKNKKRIKIFWAKDKSKWNLNEFRKIIKNKKIYLTFDVDGFDASLMPATGTPEPGGFLWQDFASITKANAIAWAQAAIGTDAVTAIETGLEDKITEQKTPSIESKTLPWS